MTSVEIRTESFQTPDSFSTQMTYLIDASSGDITVTLATKLKESMKCTVKKIDSTLNRVYVVTADGSTIDGLTQFDVGLQYNSIQVVSHLGKWYVV